MFVFGSSSYIAVFFYYYYFNRSGTSSVGRALDCWAGGGLDSRGRTITQAQKVARYSFSGSIPPKFEHKLRHHKQKFGKIATTVVSDKDEDLVWSGLQWQKVGNSVISLLGQLRCRCNPDHNKFSSLFNATVVAIFPNLCLWWHSFCSNLGFIDPKKLYRATLKYLRNEGTAFALQVARSFKSLICCTVNQTDWLIFHFLSEHKCMCTFWGLQKLQNAQVEETQPWSLIFYGF